ncbi:hypothetical protein [Acinetobacter gerneri]|uniref:hypothetical protein n=1 Tax=Acinetobacter gerneri TaxID=202952 RepID=UPI0028AB120C|nr:hypothetical protein [Acinetobacter gerneri]
MNNIISAQEAISAVQAGKIVLCRYAGNGTLHPDQEFSTLNQVPATVFFAPDYEFCIKRETTTLAEIQFTKPAQPHDLESGQEIFIVMPTCILRTQYDSEHGDICLSVANGFAQLDEENAKLQLQAFGKTFGNMITDIEVKDGFNDKPKKRAARSKKVEEQKPTVVQSVINSIENSLVAESMIEKAQDTQYRNLLNELIERASLARTVIEANALYKYTAQWTDEQRKPLEDAINAKISKLEKDEFHLDIGKKSKYEIEFADLHAVVMHAETPAEANDVIGRTQHWTEEQRKPLIVEISKKLADLNPPEKSESSLMCRINNCQTLEELDLKVLEVQQCDPVIQDRLMSYVNQRRTEISLAADDRMPWDDE